MKKIVSLICVVASFFALTTSVFADTVNFEVSGGTLEGTTITYDKSNKDGLIIKYVPDADFTSGGNAKATMTEFINAGWTYTSVDGAYVTAGFDTQNPAANSDNLQVKFNNGTHAVSGKATLMFKLVPGDNADMSKDLSLKFKPLYKFQSGYYRTETTLTVTFTDGGDDDKVTTSTSTLGATVVNYPADYAGAKNFDGKYIVFKDGTIPSSEITKDTTFNVTYDNTTKNFGGSIFKTLDVEGTGTIATGTYGIGVAFDFDVAPGDVTIAVAE